MKGRATLNFRVRGDQVSKESVRSTAKPVSSEKRQCWTRMEKLGTRLKTCRNQKRGPQRFVDRFLGSKHK